MINPITDFGSVFFVVAYICTGFIVVGIVSKYILTLDGTDSLDLPGIPADFDPYEIAYLRNGENTLLPLAVTNLVEQGFLEFSSGDRIVRTEKSPQLAQFSPIESVLYEWASEPRTKDEFKSVDFQKARDLMAVRYQESLQESQLLDDGFCERVSAKISWTGVVF